MKINNLIAFCCFVIVTNLFVPNIVAAMGDPYQAETTRLGVHIYEILIREGVCKNHGECNKNEIVFGDSDSRVNFYIYGVSDVNVVLKIFSFVAIEGKGYTNNVPISVMSYPDRKKKHMGISGFFVKPEFKIEVN